MSYSSTRVLLKRTGETTFCITCDLDKSNLVKSSVDEYRQKQANAVNSSVASEFSSENWKHTRLRTASVVKEGTQDLLLILLTVLFTQAEEYLFVALRLTSFSQMWPSHR